MTVTRCSANDADADVLVRDDGAGLAVFLRAQRLGTAPGGLFAVNVACAVGAAAALGVPAEAIGQRLRNLGAPAHRAQVTEAASGVVVIDDTYNSNPEGAAAALRLMASTGNGRPRKTVVVTPGMIELGPQQREQNQSLAAAAAQVATHLVVVGHSNRPALLAGARGGAAEVVVVADREEAARYVRSLLSAGDLVLYENDLPDHHP